MRMISDNNLMNVCKFRHFMFDRDNHTKGDYYCKADGDKKCNLQCSIPDFFSADFKGDKQ